MGKKLLGTAKSGTVYYESAPKEYIWEGKNGASGTFTLNDTIGGTYNQYIDNQVNPLVKPIQDASILNKHRSNILELLGNTQSKKTMNEVPDYTSRQAFMESAFNPDAFSKKVGATGMFQIVEDVYNDYVKATGEKGDLKNPAFNLKVRNWYINDLRNASFINKAGQDPIVKEAKVLAAYNWGRGNLLKYLNKKKEAGVDIYKSLDWIEDLPDETKNYIKFILLNEDINKHKNDSAFNVSLNKISPEQRKIYGFTEGGQVPELNMSANYWARKLGMSLSNYKDYQKENFAEREGEIKPMGAFETLLFPAKSVFNDFYEGSPFQGLARTVVPAAGGALLLSNPLGQRLLAKVPTGKQVLNYVAPKITGMLSKKIPVTTWNVLSGAGQVSLNGWWMTDLAESILKDPLSPSNAAYLTIPATRAFGKVGKYYNKTKNYIKNTLPKIKLYGR